MDNSEYYKRIIRQTEYVTRHTPFFMKNFQKSLDKHLIQVYYIIILQL